MNKNENQIDKLFEQARREQPLVSMDEARSLTGQKAGAQSPDKLNKHVKHRSGINKMKFIAGSLAVAAAVGVISLTPFGSENTEPAGSANIIEQKADVDTPDVSADKAIAITEAQNDPDKTASRAIDRDLALNQTEIQAVDDKASAPANVRGVRLIELTRPELENLGVVFNNDGMELNVYEEGNLSTSIFLTPENLSVNIYDKNDQIRNAISPRFITDFGGNQRLSLLNERDKKAIFLTKTHSFSDSSGNLTTRLEEEIDNHVQIDENLFGNPQIRNMILEELKKLGLDSLDIMDSGTSMIKVVSKNDSNFIKMGTENDSLIIRKKLIHKKVMNSSDSGLKEIKINIDTSGEDIDWIDEDQEVFLKSDMIRITDADSIDLKEMMQGVSNDFEELLKINKFIAVTVSLGSEKDYDYILWFDPTPEIVEKLPARVRETLEPEILALAQTKDVCETAIAGEDTYFDVWRACSGAVEHMNVFPNPTSGKVNVNFSLNEGRKIDIAVHDLFGNKIQTLATGLEKDSGEQQETIQLKGLEAGMYLIVLQTDYGEQAVQRIILR